MPNEIFSGIPSLDDTEGLNNYLNNSALAEMGMAQPDAPAAQDPTPVQATEAQPAAQEAAPQTQSAPAYTSEQIQQIIARNQQLENAMRQTRAQATPSQVTPTAQYTPQQRAIVNELLNRGVPFDTIAKALHGNASDAAAAQTARRVQAIESYLQNQQYLSDQAAFVNKMTAFGDKYGLSENELVTFGNKAMAMGINLTTVNDVEAVFRAVYPEQYAIRSQRLANNSTSEIYGGSSIAEAPRASTSKMEDAYVDAFLKRSMPNLYGTAHK